MAVFLSFLWNEYAKTIGLAKEWVIIRAEKVIRNV